MEPSGQRYGEALFGAVKKIFWYIVIEYFFQQVFTHMIADLEVFVQVERKLYDPVIEKWGTGLQGELHTGYVYFDQQVIFEVIFNVIERLLFPGGEVPTQQIKLFIELKW